MNWKKIVLGTLLAGLFSCQAFAQQADDQPYKDMLQSQHFKLICQKAGSQSCTMILADGDTRIVGDGTLEKDKLLWSPKAMYKAGKLYSFFTEGKETKARVLALNDINREDLDPEEEWPKTYRKMALPKGLDAFAWGDSWRKKPVSMTEPVFKEESQISIGGVEYMCNQYTSDILTQAGSTSGVITYNMLYRDGKLAKVQRYLLCNGQEKLLDTLNIINFTQEVPESDLKPWSKPIRVYKADAADLNDLMNYYVQVEVLGEDTNEKK